MFITYGRTEVKLNLSLNLTSTETQVKTVRRLKILGRGHQINFRV